MLQILQVLLKAKPDHRRWKDSRPRFVWLQTLSQSSQGISVCHKTTCIPTELCCVPSSGTHPSPHS